MELLRPLARFCLKHSISHKQLSEAAKLAFVDAAKAEAESKNQEFTLSRLSMMTGIYREEINRILKRKKDLLVQPDTTISRVMSQWRYDKRFVDAEGQPRILPYRGVNSDFWKLAKDVSKSLNPSAVAEEMVRAGYAVVTEEGLQLLLAMQTYAADPKAGFALVSRDVDALLVGVEENVTKQPKISNVHIHTEYDNIAKHELPKIRRWIMDQSKEFHRKVRAFLSEYDRDINPDIPAGPGVKVIVGGFSLTPNPDE
ncbi:MAG: hypothetical protein K1X83_10235 [Oligoflexia bacterium]|nr:hypothetical protein [Oligoflexia bacterium]